MAKTTSNEKKKLEEKKRTAKNLARKEGRNKSSKN